LDLPVGAVLQLINFSARIGQIRFNDKIFQEARQKMDLKIGKSKIMQGSVLNLSLSDNSVDAVITSPPYSFAIDYLKMISHN